MVKRYFVKSFEEDFILKTVRGKKKVSFQSLKEIINKGIIKPNTLSFGRKMRLSTTILHTNYLKTYRPQGIIFTTSENPDYVLPFDLVLLTATEKIVVHYYRIKDSLQVYYNHTLIPGFERFILKNFETLIKKYSSPAEVWKKVNEFRKKSGFKTLPREKFRLVMYNEAVFHKAIKINPLVVFGYRKEAYRVARAFGLPHYRTAKEFYEKYSQNE